MGRDYKHICQLLGIPEIKTEDPLDRASGKRFAVRLPEKGIDSLEAEVRRFWEELKEECHRAGIGLDVVTPNHTHNSIGMEYSGFLEILPKGSVYNGRLRAHKLIEKKIVTPLVTIVSDTDMAGENDYDGINYNGYIARCVHTFQKYLSPIVVIVQAGHMRILNFNMDDSIEKLEPKTLLRKMLAPIVPPEIREYDIRRDVVSSTCLREDPYVASLEDAGLDLYNSNLFPDQWMLSSDEFSIGERLIIKDLIGERGSFHLGFVQVIPPDNTRDAIRWYSLRSGCDKLHIKPQQDVYVCALEKGRRIIYPTEFQERITPSFDYGVQAALAAGSVLYFPDHKFTSVIHSHGSWNIRELPEGIVLAGVGNPRVACGTDEAAIANFIALEDVYLLMNRLPPKGPVLFKYNGGFINGLDYVDKKKYNGPILNLCSIIVDEGGHGFNWLTPYPLPEAAKYLVEHRGIAVLGSRFRDFYNRF